MSIQGTSDSYIIRDTSSWFDPSQDWTKCFHLNILSAPGTIEVIWFYGAFDYGGKFIFLGIDAGATTLDFSYFDGVTETEVDNIVCGTGDKYIAIQYNSSAHTLKLYIDGTLAATLSVDLSTLDPQDSELFLNDGDAGGYDGNKFTVSYERFWQRVLSNTELTAEDTSITPVSVLGILSSCPLQTSIDITDHVRTSLAVFTSSGTVTTNTTDPLLSTIAGPPSNTLPATALTVTTDSAVFQTNTLVGVPQETWYKCTATENTVWGALAFFSTVTNLLGITVYEGLANANSNTSLLPISETIVPIQFPVTSGTTYYFKVNIDSGTPTLVQFSLLASLSLTVPIGSIGINADVAPKLCVFLDQDTGYPIKFTVPFTSTGDGGSVLSNGNLLLTNNENTKPNLYDFGMNVLTEVNLPLYSKVSSSLTLSQFLVGKIGSAGTVFSHLAIVSSAGVILSDISTEQQPLLAIGVNPAFTICYYVRNPTTNEVVRRWDLVNNIAFTDLVAGIVNFREIKDIVVLSDNTVIVGYIKTTVTKNYKILAYSTVGATLHTYDLGATHVTTDNRLASSLDDPDTFWTWTKRSDGKESRFIEITVSDGSFVHDFSQPLFEAGGSDLDLVDTPIRFGHPESCPFWITRVAVSPVSSASGLYKLTGTNINNPRITHDSTWIDASAGTTQNVAIPDPFAESYLAGDE